MARWGYITNNRINKNMGTKKIMLSQKVVIILYFGITA